MGWAGGALIARAGVRLLEVFQEVGTRAPPGEMIKVMCGQGNLAPSKRSQIALETIV